MKDLFHSSTTSCVFLFWYFFLQVGDQWGIAESRVRLLKIFTNISPIVPRSQPTDLVLIFAL